MLSITRTISRWFSVTKGLFDAWAVVGFEIADGVLYSSQHMGHLVRHGVDMLAVADHIHKDAAFAFAANPAEGVVAVSAFGGCGFFCFVRVAHLCVVDTSEHMY